MEATFTAQSLETFALASFVGSKIDVAAGIIRGVAVITAGKLRAGDVRAFQIDATTLQQIKAAAETYSGGLKVKVTHDGDVADIAGTLRNFRIEGDVLRADLHLLENAPSRAYVLEIAQKIPDSFGLSVNFSGMKETVGNTVFARCTEIYSCDIVDEPAANPDGLFDARRKNEAQTLPDIMEKELLAAISAAVTEATKPLIDRLSKLEEVTNPESLKAQLSAITTTMSDESQEKLAKKLISEFKLGLPPGAAAGASGAAVAPADDKNKKPESFEAGVIALKKAGKNHNQAVEAVMTAHPDLHATYLSRVGRGEIIRLA